MRLYQSPRAFPRARGEASLQCGLTGSFCHGPGNGGCTGEKPHMPEVPDIPLDYEVSGGLLSEIWSALRAPVLPHMLAPASTAIEYGGPRACRLGQQELRDCFETILFHAAGNVEFTPETRTELMQLLKALPCCFAAPSHAAAPPEPLLSIVAPFCVKLEMLGFESDSGRVLEAVRAELCKRHKRGTAAAPREVETKRIEERLRKRVILRGKSGRGHRKVRTLRTHRGFIIQSYLGRDLEPVRLEVFGPRYKRVGDWMASLNADAAWSLELRDAPGYNPDCASSFSSKAAGGSKIG